ncbi:MAG: DUF4394 domain-containing protein, partial [Gammaproteobacteria bacterium]|nr:DUF4394 domain-containing protein [Gammaproteobacteria bacterium]
MINPSSDSKRHLLRSVGAALLAASVALPSVASAAERDENLSVVGLTQDGRLVSFKTESPGRSNELSFVSGFVGSDTQLIGIDYRVQDNLLYGVGDAGGIYTLDPSSGQLNLVTNLTVDLNGNAFGVDFNPAADALRVVSNRGQNLRHPFAGPTMFQTAVDGTLTYPATTTTPEITARGVTGSAYTNNDLDATTSTTLFGIDTKLDQVVVQSPANAGLVQATGSLGVNASQWVGFDNYSEIQNGQTQFIRGFASLRIGGTDGALYEVELLTGKAASLGKFK